MKGISLAVQVTVDGVTTGVVMPVPASAAGDAPSLSRSVRASILDLVMAAAREASAERGSSRASPARKPPPRGEAGAGRARLFAAPVTC